MFPQYQGPDDTDHPVVTRHAKQVVLTLIPSSPVVIAVQCLFCIAAIGIGNALVGSPKLSEMTGPVWKAYLQYGVLFVGGICG